MDFFAAEWLRWSEWTGCSATCGQGRRIRTRGFTPGREGPGIKPKGSDSETKLCGSGKCRAQGKILKRTACFYEHSHHDDNNIIC